MDQFVVESFNEPVKEKKVRKVLPKQYVNIMSTKVNGTGHKVGPKR